MIPPAQLTSRRSGIVSVSANFFAARASEAADCTDSPTMMIHNSNSRRNVCAIHEMIALCPP
jgi:hypothetical protein